MFEKEYNMVATTMFGLESTLEQELIEIGAKKIVQGNRCVYFLGSKSLMYKANIQLRTALKILKTMKQFQAHNEKVLYTQASRIKWDSIFNVNNTFSVSSTVNSKYFTHSKYVSLVIKDAIVDQFRKYKSQRPSVDIKNPDFNIHIHISQKNCTISINSSGPSLHKRGYRSNQFNAPINEVLAAGVIMLSNWSYKEKLIDPMCGSGTLLIEAAMIAINRAPNINRNFFGFQKWKDYDEELYNTIIDKSSENEIKYNQIIQGYDISASAIAIARNNVENSKLNHIIKIDGKNFFKSSLDLKSILIFNPPYGKRIELRPDYYKQIGDTLKNEYTDACVWMICSDNEELKKIGLKPSKKIKLYNGSLECKLLKYEIYKGSKKH